MEPEQIVVRGAQHHNLKNVDVSIPRYQLVVLTGVSGSGKSSLAFDTIYAEGQRRYVESLSAYARQFLGQMEKPKVDAILGLSPAIAIEQKTVSKNPRSTVGTVTEVMDYLRVLFARVGTPHCPQCGRTVRAQSAQEIADQLASLPPGTRFQLLAPIVRQRKGTQAALLKQARQDGYVRARVDGELMELSDPIKLDKNFKHTIELVVDRLQVPTEVGPNSLSELEDFRARLVDSVETTLRAGEGLLVALVAGGEEWLLSEQNACPHCGISFPELSPQLFSFNSPLGMCSECNGLGTKMEVDPTLIVADPTLSILDGATRWYGNLRKKGGKNWTGSVLDIAAHYGVDLELPWQELPESFRTVLLHGSGEEKVRFTYSGESEESSWQGESLRPVKGIIHHISRLFRQTRSEWSRHHYAQFMSEQPCPACQGARLRAEARAVTVGETTLTTIGAMTIAEAHRWVTGLAATGSDDRGPEAMLREWSAAPGYASQNGNGQSRPLQRGTRPHASASPCPLSGWRADRDRGRGA